MNMPALIGHQFGSPLTEADYDLLAESYLSREIVDSALIRRVTTEEAREMFGRHDYEDYAGLIFPYIFPGEFGVRSHRLRRDNPPMTWEQGQRRLRDKYISAPGYANVLYFHPSTSPAVLTDCHLPFVFLEGQKKALAVLRLAWEAKSESAEAPPFVPVGLNGVWGWHGRTGITISPNGKRVPEKGPISDLARIEWCRRKVYILFDTNVATNHKVATARNALALELAHRGAEVWFVDLPQEEGINGIDDYLGRHGCGPAMELFKAARLFDPREKLASLTFTDFGNEQAFQILFGENYLYNFTSLQWLHWQGSYWEPDFTNTVDRAMLEVAAARLQATALIPDVEPPSTGKNVSDKQKAVKASLRLQDVQKRKAAIESARSNPHFARRAEDFDAEDFLFACGNGVIDLKSGGFRAGQRSDMLTKFTPVYWIPEAECNVWTKFLSEVFPAQQEMWRFLQQAVGYSLSGSTREEVFFILSGRGRNGKGTFLRALTALLGDYAATTEFSTLISDPDRRKGVRNDIAALAGRRFVTAQESREGAHFDESLIKTLTGGDLITARFLNKEFFTFLPTWKIWLATNHKPNIKGSDEGIWSRPRIIEFNVSFEGRENRGLKDELLKPTELSGMLRWAVKGWLDYQQNGLQYPKEVLQATATYRAESDLIGRFIEDRCVRSESSSAKARPLYQDFSRWRQEAGEPEMTETAFCKRLAEKGFKKKHGESGSTYLGIGLRWVHPDVKE